MRAEPVIVAREHERRQNGEDSSLMALIRMTGPHTKAYVCTHVFERSERVLLVSRPEGDWCFLCGQLHDDDASSYKVVGVGHLFEQDSSLCELEDLPPNWEAEREKPEDPWLRTPIDPTG